MLENDFQWIKDIVIPDLTEGEWAIHLDGLSEMEKLDVQQILVDNGWRWINTFSLTNRRRRMNGKTKKKPLITEIMNKFCGNSVEGYYISKTEDGFKRITYGKKFFIPNGSKYVGGRTLLNLWGPKRYTQLKLELNYD